MVADVIKRTSRGTLLVDLDCEAGTLRFAVNADGTQLADLDSTVAPPFTPSREAWLAIGEAVAAYPPAVDS